MAVDSHDLAAIAGPRDKRTDTLRRIEPGEVIRPEHLRIERNQRGQLVLRGLDRGNIGGIAALALFLAGASTDKEQQDQRRPNSFSMSP